MKINLLLTAALFLSSISVHANEQEHFAQAASSLRDELEMNYNCALEVTIFQDSRPGQTFSENAFTNEIFTYFEPSDEANRALSPFSVFVDNSDSNNTFIAHLKTIRDGYQLLTSHVAIPRGFSPTELKTLEYPFSPSNAICIHSHKATLDKLVATFNRSAGLLSAEEKDVSEEQKKSILQRTTTFLSFSLTRLQFPSDKISLLMGKLSND